MKSINELEQNATAAKQPTHSTMQQADLSQFAGRGVKEENDVEPTGDGTSGGLDALAAMVNKAQEEDEELNKQLDNIIAEREEEMEIEEAISDEEDNDENSDEEEEEDEVEDEVVTDDDDEPEESVSLDDVDEEELDADLKELLDEDNMSVNDDEDPEKERRDKLKAAINSKIKPISDTLDLSTFTVVNQPVSVNAVLDDTVKDEVVWALMSSMRSIHMKRFKGSDIENLDPQTENSGLSRLQTLRKVYRTLFEAITDSNKPESFEAWLRSTSFIDINNIYMAVYRGAFEGANYLTYECENPECGHIWLSDNVDIMDMCKFKDDKAKEMFYELLDKESSPEDNLYVTEVVPISNKYAISFREPSIFNVIFENATLSSKFTNKYADMLSIIMYIDNIYTIDAVNKTLKPIALKTYPNDMKKNTKIRVYTYAKILKSLPSDQYAGLSKYINAINDRAELISYVKPGCTCPKCGAKIEEEPANPQTMVFQRHNLEAIANS